jgi:hypothetical protein
MKNLKPFTTYVENLPLTEKDGENLRDLISTLQDLGFSATPREIEMKKFISDFGANKNSEEWAEYLDDYYRNPEEYSIDTNSDYYGLICKFYEDSVEPHARFILSGPMRMMTFDRFDYDRISETPEYKLYSRMSKE